MRPSNARSRANRERIVATAARLFRAHGIQAVGVDAVMRAAGLTHGGFYGHFGSKRELVAEALDLALEGNLRFERGCASLDELATHYLSPEHCANPAEGCALAALGPELARLPAGERGTTTAKLDAQIAAVQALGPGADQAGRQRAIQALVSLVGGLVLARACDDPALAEEILAAARAAVAAGPLPAEGR